LKLSTQF